MSGLYQGTRPDVNSGEHRRIEEGMLGEKLFHEVQMYIAMMKEQERLEVFNYPELLGNFASCWCRGWW
jgi:hypothetical protein